MLVKVCGIRSSSDALLALNHGADAIGVIVDVPVDTPRKVSVEKAREIQEALTGRLHTFITVIMPEYADEAVEVYEALKPDGIQLHGTESPEMVRDIRKSVDAYIIKTIHADEGVDYDYVKAVAKYADFLLADTRHGRKTGGTGRTHDRRIDLRIKRTAGKPLIISGGLNPSNVRDAILHVRPHGVDVSSGVESMPGVKDGVKLSEFMRAVDETD